MTKRVRMRSVLAAVFAAALCGSWAACQLPTYLPPLGIGEIHGYVVAGGTPVRDATVEIFELEEDGTVKRGIPLFTAQTDEDGRFDLVVEKLPPPYLVTARGGRMREFWAGDEIRLESDVVQLRTVIAEGSGREIRNVVLSPYTTIAEALVERRLALGKEATYAEASERVYGQLDAHFDVDLRASFPARLEADSPSVIEDVRYMLALAGLSSIAQSFEARSEGRSVQTLNTLTVMEALVEDARGPDAVLDGRGPDGPIAIDDCEPPCALGSDTLRRELVRAILSGFLMAPQNVTGLDFADASVFLERLAGSTDETLFGIVEPGKIDDEAPVITPLPLLVFDDSQDAIDVDPVLAPVHFHSDAAVVDTASMFGGACGREIHKHVNLLRSDEESPFRWRFALVDDAVGVKPEDIKVTVRPPTGAAPLALDVAAVELPESGYALGSVFEAAASSDVAFNLLASTEGRFDIEISAKDQLGNVSEVAQGCFTHVPRAAPLYAGPVVSETGPGTLDGLNLENDDLPLVFGESLPASLGYPLVSIPIANNTDTTVYLTLNLDQLTGSFSRTWLSSRAFVRSDASISDCLSTTPPTCFTAFNSQPQEDVVTNAPLPSLADSSLYFALRVIDTEGGSTLSCPECRPNEVRLEPHRGFAIQLVATRLDFLVPAVVDSDSIRRISIGPSDDRVQLTGFVEESDFQLCIDTQADGCHERKLFALYQALTDASIDIQSLRVVATSASRSTLPSRTPQPPYSGSESTLANPILGSYAWSTTEQRVPPTDSN